MIAGKALATAKLDADVSGPPTMIEMASLRFHVIVRGERVGIRVKDLESAAVANFKGLIFYPLDLNYRVTATWEPSDGKKMIDIPDVLGDVTPVPVAGMVVFKINGQEQRLAALGGDPSKGLSFVFNDLTAKSDTYPGGRFLDTDPVANGACVAEEKSLESSLRSDGFARRRAPATTSYLLSSSSRTRRGARTPCVLKLAAFCALGHFVAENA
jgi:uncharacterized protein